MNGIRFYQEFSDKSKRKPGGTVVAALVLNGRYWSSGTICYEALAAVFDQPNSPVAGTGVSLDYLRQKCRWIGEAHARTIHPVLFERLSSPSRIHPGPSAYTGKGRRCNEIQCGQRSIAAIRNPALRRL